jgi:uncharacterized membrane protein
MMALGIALHALAAAFWVGGMAFAYMILRPSVGELAGPDRLRLWERVFSRFLPLVWLSVVLLLLSGYWGLFGYYGGFAASPVHVHIMHLTGWLMFLLFFHLWFAPWKRFRAAVAAGRLDDAAAALTGIRRTVALNLALGTFTIAVGASGRFWP